MAPCTFPPPTIMDFLPNIPEPVFAFCGCVLALLFIRRMVRKPKYLPGPPGLPLLGNILQIPDTDSWELYAEWRALYGLTASTFSELMLMVLRQATQFTWTRWGSSIIVLNSYKACIDLLEKRSDIYSDRPVMRMAREMWAFFENIGISIYYNT